MSLAQFLVDVAKSVGPVPWEAWYAISIDAQAGDRWADAWGRLSVDQQYAVLERLHADGSVFADTLLQLAARHSIAVVDLPVREMMLSDAADAGERQVRALRARQAELSAAMGATATEQADLLASITSLEAELARFMSEHVSDEFDHMVLLQQQVARLQGQADELASYDWTGRESLRQQLVEEVTMQGAQRDTLDESIGELRARRAELQRDVDSATDSAATIQVEIDRLTLQGELAGQDLATQRNKIAAMSGERSRIVGERAELAARLDQLATQLHQDRQSLQELQGSPLSADAERINAEIDALFVQFPEDQADHMFGTRS